MSDDDDESFRGIFEDGHWVWDDVLHALDYKSNSPKIKENLTPAFIPTAIGSLDFKEDLDLHEQQRFRKRFQRKTTENDVIQLQDIKDLVLFTAPKVILTPSVINILHMPLTERFLRALLLYSQYYLQISDEMIRRTLELQEKIRTPKSEETELEFRDNLEDLRLLVAKEYSCMIIGGGEIARYHHMGISKKLRSLLVRDSILFETILRISIQIVWLALGRKSYNQLELEIHRLFKSEMYNNIEHKLKTTYTRKSKFTQWERFVLFGHCVYRNKMINTFSPLNNEMHCDRHIDYRIFGLGSVKYPRLTSRLRYFEHALVLPENKFEELKMSLGILGLPRSGFDTMLKEIKMLPSTASSSAGSFRHSVGRSSSRASRVSSSLKKSGMLVKLFENIYIPEKYGEEECFLDQFPTEMLPKKRCNEEQRRRWISYVSCKTHVKRNIRVLECVETKTKRE